MLVTLLVMQPGIQSAFWIVSAQCQPISRFSSINIPNSFSSGLLLIHSSPSLYWYWRLPWPRCRALHLTLLSLMRFTWTHFLSLSRSSGWCSFPPACWPHHSACCHLQTCWILCICLNVIAILRMIQFCFWIIIFLYIYIAHKSTIGEQI